MRKESNTLHKFHALRSALISEREAIQKRLNELNTVLGGGEAPAAVVAPASAPVPKRRGRPPGQKNRVVANTMSLQQAVLKVLTSTPVTKQALLDAVRKIGYRFASSNPMNSLQTFLYGTGKKLVKKVDGKFAAVGSSAPAPVAKAQAAKPAKGKAAVPGTLTLRQALFQVLANGPKTRKELLSGVQVAGYRFAAKKPVDSLKSFLSGAGKKLFKKVDGKKYALLAGVVPASAPVAKVQAATPVQKKRKISAAGRKAIAEAAKKMWVARRAAKTGKAKK